MDNVRSEGGKIVFKHEHEDVVLPENDGSESDPLEITKAEDALRAELDAIEGRGKGFNEQLNKLLTLTAPGQHKGSLNRQIRDLLEADAGGNLEAATELQQERLAAERSVDDLRAVIKELHRKAVELMTEIATAKMPRVKAEVAMLVADFNEAAAELFKAGHDLNLAVNEYRTAGRRSDTYKAKYGNPLAYPQDLDAPTDLAAVLLRALIS
jgi:hypothetical protein